MTPLDTGWADRSIESSSAAMRAVVRILATVASHDVPVLLRGESGSGKSTLARALHAASERRERPLVAIDCQELQAGALASARIFAARLEEANGGSVLLEEIGALPDRYQAAVVSLLDLHRLGRRSADVRVIATSHLDLEGAARVGRFREDLLTRVAVVEVWVPPLRDRPEDILPLARRFLAAFVGPGGMAELTPRAQRALLAYPWPGNVRELRNAMQRAVVLSRSAALDLEVLPPKLSALVGDS
jgi:NtrC-family two-component system response regulator AlgB